MHEGNEVREFYAQLPRPVLVGIEATGSMYWFLDLMAELEIECRVGHPVIPPQFGRRNRGSRNMIGGTRS